MNKKTEEEKRVRSSRHFAVFSVRLSQLFDPTVDEEDEPEEEK